MIFRPSELKRKIFFIVFDIVIILFSTLIAFELRFDFAIPSQYISSIYIAAILLVIIRVSLFYYARIYDISWRHFGFKDATALVLVMIASTLILLLLSYFLRTTSYVIPRSIIPIEFFISLVLILALRGSKRLYLDSYRVNADGKRTIIVASLDRANSILRTIQSRDSDYSPVAIINETNQHIKINGVEVYTLESFIASEIKAEVAILDDRVEIVDIYEKMNDLGITKIKVASDYSDYGAEIKNISVEDLLARYPKDLDKDRIRDFIEGKVILITGAGGSIGSEICRKCESFGAKKLILIDNCEYNLYAINEELQDIKRVTLMQSVVNKESMDATLAKYRPEIVIHAAAYKHVPLVEVNIHEGIVNNIIGTKNMIDSSIRYGVEKFVLISTDKAVRPTNIMGATKRICELYAQNANGQGTDIVAVRFGNVLGSSGSVIPKFRSQIQAGKKITVTHPEITRFFMLIPEACELVLQAGAIGSGGEIFILDMGKPVKIVDLAKKMIELSGKPNIKIEFTGLRPGEKLYEELLIDESQAKTDYESITVAMPTPYDLTKLNKDIEELLVCEDKIAKLKEIVPEFHHQTNKK